LLPGEEAGFAEDFFGEFGFQAVAEEETGIGGEADAEASNHFFVKATTRQIFAGAGAFGTAETFLEKCDGAFVDIEELAAEAGLFGFAGRGVAGFGQRDAEFLCNQADGFGESDVLDFLDEAEDVAFFLASEAVVELLGGVDGKGRSFFAVKGAEAGVVLRAGFFELDVVADDADDVRLLLEGVGEVAGVGHFEAELSVGIVREKGAEGNIADGRICGKVVGIEG
jgi:hypothetical protein